MQDNPDNYPKGYLQQILADVKTIAVVGASPRADRDSYLTMQTLLNHHYKVYPVNPKEAGKQILGQYCYATLSDIEKPVDMVDIFRSSDAALDITLEALDIGASVVWMQLGIVNHVACHIAKEAGLRVVMDRCPKIELEKTLI